ncbi:MAG: hypothetical protein U9R36_00105, partial [Elusimicrobiota bacterium]|nr:hypothetical protein [Elusimicrobiota bacterium]
MFFKRLLLLMAASVLSIVSPSGSAVNADISKGPEMTIYNNNRAFIKDTRELFLPPGESQLVFTGISSNIVPDTVYLMAAENNIDILSQTYSPGIRNKKSLLDSFVGKELKVVSYDRNNNPSRTVKAKLLSNNDGPVYEIDGEIYLNYPGRPVLPEFPDGFYEKPQISWQLSTPESFDGELTAFYMAGGINWAARYNLIINPGGQKAGIDALISIDNRSGTAYNNAFVKLIAGKVNTSPGSVPMRAMEARMDYAAAPAREKISGYHQYSLQRPVTLENNRKQELTLFSAGEVPVSREYVSRSMSSCYRTNRTGEG